MKETKFKVGDKAFKSKGYKFPCTIVSVFETLAGNIRVVAEMDEYGLLHIFNEDQLEKKTKSQKLELLNSEGAILTAIQTDENSFIVIDQYKVAVADSKKQILDFVKGLAPITDSKNKEWWYKECSEGMRQKEERIINFLNS